MVTCLVDAKGSYTITMLYGAYVIMILTSVVVVAGAAAAVLITFTVITIVIVTGITSIYYSYYNNCYCIYKTQYYSWHHLNFHRRRRYYSYVCIVT